MFEIRVKKTRFKWIGFLLAIITLTGCQTNKSFKSDKNAEIRFGSFGGFAGSYDEYTLSPDGVQHHRTSPDGAFNRLANADPADVVKCFGLAAECLILDVRDMPGNLTNFIYLYRSGEPIKQFVWEEGQSVPTPLTDLNRLLKSLVRSKNPIM